MAKVPRCSALDILAIDRQIIRGLRLSIRLTHIWPHAGGGERGYMFRHHAGTLALYSDYIHFHFPRKCILSGNEIMKTTIHYDRI